MTAFLSNPSSKKQFFLLLVDGIIVLSAFMFSYSFRVVVYKGGHISLLGERLSWLVGAAANNLLLIGDSPLNREIMGMVKKSLVKYYNPANNIINYKENSEGIDINGTMGNKTISDMVKKKDIHTIVIPQKLKGSPTLRSELLNLKFAGVSIYDAPVFYKE